MGRAPYLFLTLGITQALHSIEETVFPLYEYFPAVTSLLHARAQFIPIVTMDATTFAILNMVIIASLLSLASFVFLGRTWALWMARVVAVVEILNGTGHVSAALISGGYWPGCASGVGLVIIGVLFLYLDRRGR